MQAPLRLEDLHAEKLSGIPLPKTTARAHLIRHAEKLGHLQRTEWSVVEMLSRARSLFQLWTIEQDAEMFVKDASAKVRMQWKRTAYVKRCELMGVLP